VHPKQNSMYISEMNFKNLVEYSPYFTFSKVAASKLLIMFWLYSHQDFILKSGFFPKQLYQFFCAIVCKTIFAYTI